MKEIKITPRDGLSETLSHLSPGTRVILSCGIYREKIEIAVPDTEIVGEDPEKTVIIYDDYAKKPDGSGNELITFRTYTAAVLAPRVRLANLTVRNDALSPETKGQEVALSVCADEFSAEGCRFISTQDTVFCGPLPPDLIERYDGFLKDELRTPFPQRQIFRDCFIAGTVDFIFGCGDALFDRCVIESLFEKRGVGYAAAPAHGKEQEIGFVFKDCRFTREKSVPDKSVYLARPWRDFGKASFIGCEYGGHIAPEGFDKWNDTNRDRTARFSEDAPPAGRVPWSGTLSENEIKALLAHF